MAWDEQALRAELVEEFAIYCEAGPEMQAGFGDVRLDRLNRMRELLDFQQPDYRVPSSPRAPKGWREWLTEPPPPYPPIDRGPSNCRWCGSAIPPKRGGRSGPRVKRWCSRWCNGHYRDRLAQVHGHYSPNRLEWPRYMEALAYSLALVRAVRAKMSE